MTSAWIMKIPSQHMRYVHRETRAFVRVEKDPMLELDLDMDAAKSDGLFILSVASRSVLGDVVLESTTFTKSAVDKQPRPGPPRFDSTCHLPIISNETHLACVFLVFSRPSSFARETSGSIDGGRDRWQDKIDWLAGFQISHGLVNLINLNQR